MKKWTRAEEVLRTAGVIVAQSSKSDSLSESAFLELTAAVAQVAVLADISASLKQIAASVMQESKDRTNRKDSRRGRRTGQGLHTAHIEGGGVNLFRDLFHAWRRRLRWRRAYHWRGKFWW